MLQNYCRLKLDVWKKNDIHCEKNISVANCFSSECVWNAMCYSINWCQSYDKFILRTLQNVLPNILTLLHDFRSVYWWFIFHCQLQAISKFRLDCNVLRMVAFWFRIIGLIGHKVAFGSQKVSWYYHKCSVNPILHKGGHIVPTHVDNLFYYF